MTESANKLTEPQLAISPSEVRSLRSENAALKQQVLNLQSEIDRLNRSLDAKRQSPKIEPYRPTDPSIGL
jgi:molecular chaperone GrpE (heat shock protein)